MKVQRNEWNDEEHNFQSYKEATVYEGDDVRLQQISSHRDFGDQFMLYTDADTVLYMEGARMDYFQGLTVVGYVSTEENRFSGGLRREMWSILKEKNGR